MDKEVISGHWSPEEASLSINARELLAVERGLLYFQTQVSESTVSVFTVNSTAVACLRKAGGHSLGDCELHCSADSPVGGGSPRCSGPSVHHGEEQCARGRVVQAQSSPGVRVDTQVGGLSEPSQEVAGVGRSLCHLIKSPLFSLFFALPRSAGFGDG